MTNINGGASWSRYDDGRRLVVPTRHQSQVQAATSRVERQAASRPMVHLDGELSAQVRLQERTYASPRRQAYGRQSAAKMAAPVAVSRTAQTIKPLAKTTAKPTVKAPANITRTPAAEPIQSVKTANQPDFMSTMPIYSPEAILAQHRQSVAARPTMDQMTFDRQAIMERAAQVRRQAKQQAEQRAAIDAQAKIEAERQRQLAAKLRQQQAAQIQAQQQAMAAQQQLRQQLVAKRRTQAQQIVAQRVKASNPTSVMLRSAQPTESLAAANGAAMPQPTAANLVAPISPVSPSSLSPAATQQPAIANVSQLQSPAGLAISPDMPNHVSLDQSGVATVARPTNFFERLASARITFSLKINKQRLFTGLRYIAIVVIVLASGYLAWDTYTTNQSVRNTFSGNNAAAAMSIAGTNPATADQTAISQEQRAAYTVPADQPRYIYIPAIGVNARVLSVGVNSRGNIDTPSNLNDTAWYDGSAKPGQEGQVFIDGHTSFSSSINAAFNSLPKLKSGDQITIEKGDGQKVNYNITQVETVDANQVDMGKALNPPAGAKKGLTLMTCTGTFNYRSQTADKRLIVYAVEE